MNIEFYWLRPNYHILILFLEPYQGPCPRMWHSVRGVLSSGSCHRQVCYVMSFGVGACRYNVAGSRCSLLYLIVLYGTLRVLTLGYRIDARTTSGLDYPAS